MLFSKADPVGNPESNMKVLANWEKLGLKVGFFAKCTVCADYRASVICSLGTEAQHWKKSRQLILLLSAISYSDAEYVDLYLYSYLFLHDHAYLILSVLPDVREVLGPVSTCKPLLHVPEGVSGCTVCLSGWTGTCYIPREDRSKTLSLIIYVILMHRYILAALS
jgi:hypothetical protein